jgi:mRNA interferase MazF
MTRTAAISVLNAVLVAPVTRTIRAIPTELILGPDDGMPTECAANFDKLRVVPKAHLVDRICELGAGRLAEACQALCAAVDC